MAEQQDDNLKNLMNEADAARLLGESLPTEMGMGAAAMMESYESWVAAGFTPRQALWLVGCMLQGPGLPPLPDQ